MVLINLLQLFLLFIALNKPVESNLKNTSYKQPNAAKTEAAETVKTSPNYPYAFFLSNAAYAHSIAERVVKAYYGFTRVASILPELATGFVVLWISVFLAESICAEFYRLILFPFHVFW
ncbi:hypothetical protein [Rubrolithibacter danxiaensis]|uniref:hypothetical protein n=1 Tax=Rubrolithibacter danxiaensis TaxID=3390805 RepID=UPI003BF81708